MPSNKSTAAEAEHDQCGAGVDALRQCAEQLLLVRALARLDQEHPATDSRMPTPAIAIGATTIAFICIAGSATKAAAPSAQAARMEPQ
jgi:hypothetical protein